MPVNTPIVDSLIPREVTKPIPTRTINSSTTRPNINQAPNIKSSPAAESIVTEESVKLSPQLTALARKQQAHRQREQALDQREKDLEARLAEAEQYSQLKTKLSSKDFSSAEALGLTYQEYTEYLLNKQAGEDPEGQRFKALEDEIQALKKGNEEKANQEYEETVAEYKSEIAKLVAESPDFPKTKKAQKEDAVLQLILDSWEEDGLQLSVDEAARDVEAHLTEEAKKWASLMDEPVKEEVKLPPPTMGSRTLTQQMAPAGIEKQPARSLHHLPDNERFAEARRRMLERRQREGR